MATAADTVAIYSDLECTSEDEDRVTDLQLKYYTQYYGVMSDGEGGRIPERATIPSGDNTVNTLRKHFIYHEEFAIKRSISGSAMSHCPRGIAIGCEYHNLRRLMVTNARLELQRDVTSRVYQFETFIQNLKKMVQQETSSWRAIHQSRDSELENHQTNLTSLSPICDEFRMHLNHWICIKQRIQNNRWLRSCLPSMSQEIHRINRYFVQLQETTFWWIEKLVKTGLQVFAYVDRRSLTYNDVFSIVRGIEEFNTLIQLVKFNTQEMRSSSSRKINHSLHDHPLVKHLPSGAIDCGTMKTIPFIRLLHSLAVEWAKSAVAITRHSLDDNDQLVAAMQQKKCLHVDDSSQVTRYSPSPSDIYKGTTAAVSTSDYFSESHNRIGDAEDQDIDLTSRASPLLDFGKKEREYVSKLIQIACQRTTLLRKNKFHGPLNTDKKVVTQGDSVIAEETEGQFIRTEAKRKSVSWGDTHDMSVCRQLLMKYDDALWKAYGAKLDDSLNYEIIWSKPGGHKSHIGCLDLCSFGAFKLFADTVISAANKGYFTSHGSKQVIQVISMIVARTLLCSCDIAISKSLISIQTDKGVAIPLADGSKSSKTAMLLRNAVLFIVQQLQRINFQSDRMLLSKQTNTPSHQAYFDFKLKSNVISRLELITGLTQKWCVTKARQYLVAYKMSPFILITHGDLLILQREISAALKHINGELFVAKLNELQVQLNQLSSCHSKMTDDLYERAVKLTQEILADQMPNQKQWKTSQSTSPDSPTVQNYAESLVESILLPITDGAKHLCTEQQYSAIKTVLAAVNNTWQQYYLKHKVKFSLQGVHQLEVDISNILEFIETCLTNDEVKDQLLHTESVSRFSTIVKVLSEQPTDARSKATHMNTSRNKVAPATGSSTSENILSAESRILWSNLRLRIPGRHPIFPCLRVKD